jgi:hypothetical protein
VKDAFYQPDGDRFVPTEWTRGPWDPTAQHAGPPAALAGRAVEALPPLDWPVTRFTLDILKPIPVAPISVETTVVREGKRVQLAQVILGAGDTEVARAHVWRIRPADEPLPEAGLDPTPFPGPTAAAPPEPYDPWGGPSYFGAMEWRYVRGSFFEPGPGTVWMRMAVDLVAGEDPSPLIRVLSAADSGNGISGALPIDRYVFINTELSVHLVRPPVGEWVCLDAVTHIHATGIGLAESTLWDRSSRIGRGAQSLLVAPR